MQTVSQTFTAGQKQTGNYSARYFRLMDTVSAVSLAFYLNGSKVATADEVEAGFAWPAAGGDDIQIAFDRVEITSAAAQTVKFAVSEKPVAYDRGAATVDVASTPAPGVAYTQTGPTIISVSTTILAANANRRFLMIQNNDASATIWLNLAGAAAVANNGPKLPPGAALLLDVAPPTGAINGISDGVIGSGLLSVVEG